MLTIEVTRPMSSRCAILYIALVMIIALAFKPVPSTGLEQVTAMVSSRVLQAMGFASTWEVRDGIACISLLGGPREVSVAIIRECTGIHVMAIITGLIIPLRGGLWIRKALSLAASCPLLFALNISRVILTMVLTAYEVPLFAQIFTNPTVETYHYPLSIFYGLLGVALIVYIIGRHVLPELPETLIGIATLAGA